MFDILDLIHDATKEANSFENHPAKALPLEERLSYLNGLALVMNADAEISEDEKEYLRILIKSFDLDESCLNDFVTFAQAPDKDTIQAFFRTFRRKPLAQLFLFDAYMMGMRDGQLQDKERAVIDKMAEQLEILKGTRRDIFDLFCHIKNKDWTESSFYFSAHLLNPENFKHLLEYFEVDLRELLERTSTLQENRLRERLEGEPSFEWMPVQYKGEGFQAPKSEITKKLMCESLTIPYGFFVPYLQAMLDRGQLRVRDSKIYKVMAEEPADSELNIYIDIAPLGIAFDPVARVFSIPLEQESDDAKVPFIVAKEFWSMPGLFFTKIKPEDIGYGIRCSSGIFNQGVNCPLNESGKKNIGEYIFVDNGDFYEVEHDFALVGFYKKSDASFEEILNSGQFRLMR